jgi:type III pantothenate kinase
VAQTFYYLSDKFILFMLLALDIGNSDITLGLWEGSQLKQIWRIPSKPEQPELFYGVKIRDHFFEAGLTFSQVNTIVLSSVVPTLTGKVKNVIRSLFGIDPIILQPSVYEKLPIKVLNPYEIGSDLVSNAVAAWHLYKRSCIVVDFGTALTFTTISDNAQIIGVSIVPGLRTSIKALTEHTAKLFDVPLEMPKSALGTSTVTAIQSGLVIGYDGLVRSMVTAIRKETGEKTLAIATGGLSFVITSLKDFFYEVNPNLTLEGLRLIGESAAKI